MSEKSQAVREGYETAAFSLEVAAAVFDTFGPAATTQAAQCRSDAQSLKLKGPMLASVVEQLEGTGAVADPTTEQIRALGAAAGFTRTLIADVPIPASGVGPKLVTSNPAIFRGRESGGFRANDALVIVFKAPAADLAFQMTFVQTGTGVTGSTHSRQVALSSRPVDWDSPDVIWSDRVPSLGLTLASGTVPSPYSRYLLIPGKTYYVNVHNKPTELAVLNISIVASNNRP